MVYVLFLLSGISGLIYQAVWVRVFGNVFGNTVYSTSLVVAVFMLGLGAGSYVGGKWADRRYAQRPASLLRVYALVELLIAAGGIIIAAVLPRLDSIAALFASYAKDSNGWYALTPASYVARAALAVLLLTPMTVLMGATLTLLIRHLAREDLEVGDRRTALLYAVNTAGAALGCFLTDIALVPAIGLLRTQVIAAALNAVAGAGALALSINHGGLAVRTENTDKPKHLRGLRGRREAPSVVSTTGQGTVPLTSVALAMIGFAAMGMEILWFRHFSILLGAFRAVFALLLTVILVGIAAGSLLASSLRRLPERAGPVLLIVQGLFVAATLLGLASADADAMRTSVQAADGAILGPVAEIWFNARPILIEVALPALLMGFSYPLANALVQRAEDSVARRAGTLYFANTTGAVIGTIATGFVLLPWLGLQGAATALMVVAALAMIPIAIVANRQHVSGSEAGLRGYVPRFAPVIAAIALAWWFVLPADFIVSRALGTPADGEQVLATLESTTELVTVTDAPGIGRTLVTNGHPMSSTTWLGQRYMRALAHIPLLAMDYPESVLIIGFGVGNTTHAATLHPSVRSIEVADLSRNVLSHAGFFSAVNHDVLRNPRVAVYVNDGRHHLRMRGQGAYDLITLEPPPIAYAGVASLYSREFYALARTRLKPNGYISQWLPAYQVPGETTTAMISAFVEVFPQSVLLSGAAGELLLVGTNAPRIEIDPRHLELALDRSPDAAADLQRLDLGTPREIVGSFVASARRLAEATRDVAPVSDDTPVQEYGVRSLLNQGEPLPAALVDLSQLADWCPRCADGEVADLDLYLALMQRAYAGQPAGVALASDSGEPRRLAGSRYLGALLPDSADLHNTIGLALAERGRMDEAISEFRSALRVDPASPLTHWHLGAALASRGAEEEALAHLQRSVELDPRNPEARHDLEVVRTSLGHP